MITGPAGSTSAELHAPPGAGPAATITGVPATLKVKLVPTAMPAPATLQICRNPVAGPAGMVSTKVTIVCPPFCTVTVAVPAARLLATNNPFGKVETAVSTLPESKASAMLTGPAGSANAALQAPSGASPAGTVTGVPATINTKLVPGTTPAPATLQICRNPMGGTGFLAFWNVTSVCPPAAIVTVDWPPTRSLLTNDPPGEVLTAVNCRPIGRVSVMITGPAGNIRGAPQEPAGAGPAGTDTGVPATLNVKLVPSTTPGPATLQICRNPVVGAAASVKVAIVCAPAMTVTVAVPTGQIVCVQQSRAGQGGDRPSSRYRVVESRQSEPDRRKR